MNKKLFFLTAIYIMAVIGCDKKEDVTPMDTKEIKEKFIDYKFSTSDLEIKEFSVNCNITAYIKRAGVDEEGNIFDNYISNISKTKVNVKTKKNNGIEKIKIEISTIENKFEKEYTFTDARNIEKIFSETLFFFQENCSENPQSSFYPCTINKKYMRSNINEWVTTKPKAKVTIYDNKGNYISRETYIDFTLNIGKERTNLGSTYDE